MAMAQRSGMLERARSVLVVIDVQERYIPHLYAGSRLVEAVRRLVEGAKQLDVPVLITEQHPKGLGHTVDTLRQALPPGTVPIEKRSLSCVAEPNFLASLERSSRDQILVAGIEAHACVNQTVHDLLARGLEVHLPVDALSARFKRDCDVAVERLVGAGAVPTTVECALLEWVRTADDPGFQIVRTLIRDALPDDS